LNPAQRTLFILLLLDLFVTSACRYRYDALELLGAGGEPDAGGQITGGGVGGAGVPAGAGGNQVMTGDLDGAAVGTGGVGSMSLDAADETGADGGAGSPAQGGSGGQAGTGGMGGSGGQGGSPPKCTNTADCSCASIQGHSYWFCKNVLAWTESETYCETQSMHLVRVDSSVENNFLVSSGTTFGIFAYDGAARIGGSDQAVQGDWRWIDGTLFWQGGPGGAAPNGLFTSWEAAYPSVSGTRQCAALLQAGTWQDRACKFVSPFICEAP
jgi:hypothetical protein